MRFECMSRRVGSGHMVSTGWMKQSRKKNVFVFRNKGQRGTSSIFVVVVVVVVVVVIVVLRPLFFPLFVLSCLVLLLMLLFCLLWDGSPPSR